ncbi:SIW14 Inositol phosphatase SIW14 [Candida maltosa Xu316]
MSDTIEDPFQMDEEFSLKNDPDPTDSFSLDTNTNNNSNNDIAPSYPTPPDIQYDNKVIRSKLEQFKLEESSNNAGMITTTEEEGEKFEEDIDDKLDMNLQEKLRVEYEQSINHDKPLTPPENFAPVINKIYRSSFPQPNNFTFLKKLKLKSILCLIPEDYPHLQQEFIKNENIKLFQLGMSGNKEPFVKISSDLITEAIKIVLNPENQPILIHCNRGKHRTGCLVGVIRRLQNWSYTLIFDEYRKFASPKERPMDQQFIELYDDKEIREHCNKNKLLPLKWD